MKNQKLSLDAFKAMAETVQEKNVLAKINGGLTQIAAECHIENGVDTCTGKAVVTE
ncbi:hypothetical protein FEDK69T_09520 [Flavobacterium enshiense DK69]|nr:hypothetical protein [Flavobacterium enshiense]ESU24504.1 hypothetical protein FEDK69T_09520 [Flavobacterium enshiense DK69]